VYGVAATGFQFSFCIRSIQFVNWAQGRGVCETMAIRRNYPPLTRKGIIMPLVDIQLIEGVFDKNQKQQMISKVTEAMVAIEGEAMRGVTWVRVHEVASGEWAIGGKSLTTADVKALQSR
jgi:4-oxalocrotonate tautomerase